ncbi:MAG TPA: DUF6491 family protein [Luteimonas sp.]|jgi:hypothetical protein|nr:DUF6491 family protein [Luteimonas sp.]
MKRFTILLGSAALLAACASTPTAPSAQLAMYRAHAGAPVPSFRYLGRMDSWESLGDRTIAVWTRPHEAWLLDLAGPCNGLDFTPVIGLTSQVGQVSAGFDKVLVKDPANFGIPCRIQTIRPLDVKALESEAKHRREVNAPAPAAGH